MLSQLGGAARVGTSANLPEQYYGSVQPRVQEARHSRRQALSPLDRPMPRLHSELAGRDSGMLPTVGSTPSTSSALQHQEPRVAGARSAAGGSSSAVPNDDLSQDEAASLLMALPMSREPSGLERLASPRPSSTPKIGGVPMSKALSGISVTGLLDEVAQPEPSPMPPLASPALPPLTSGGGTAAPWSPRLRGVDMTKTTSTISVSGFLSVDDPAVFPVD